MITLIIPLRLSENSLYDEIERLERISTSVPRDQYTLIIVDFGTGEKRSLELKRFANKHPDFKIVRGGAVNAPFSVGEARDIGVAAAKTPVVMFNDLDFIGEKQTYIEIAEEAKYHNLDKKGYTFMCVPTVFLTAEGSDKYLNLFNDTEKKGACRFAHNTALACNKNQDIEHTALGSSALLVNRHLYLASGGHDRSFTGHGAEDFEYYNRLTNLAPCASRPPRFNENIAFTQGKWEGFRTFYALYGMTLWNRGICLVHLHHPRREHFDASYKKSSDNFKILKNRLTNFNGLESHLPPIPDSHVTEKTLIMTKPDSRAAKSLRMAIPSMGEYEFIDENSFVDPERLIQFVKNKNFSRILLLNPYGNKHRLNLYTKAREAGITCIAFDRGALNDSWFFDNDGFLGSSSNYDEDKWNNPLSEADQHSISKWIDCYKSSGNTLERNGGRKSTEEWRRELGIGNKKAILIALQRPGDTATRFFCGPTGTYQNFMTWLEHLCLNIDTDEYVLLIKKHPLESDCPSFKNAVHLPPDAHIHDMIELSDKVVALNSGVGVLSILMKKPIVVCGDAFYCKGSLSYQADSKETLVELAGAELTVDSTQSERFIHYLKNSFYSFGKSFYHDSVDASGANIRLCYKIQFSSIRQLSPESVTLGEPPRWIIPSSFLFRGTSLPTDVNLKLKTKKDQAKPKTPSGITFELLIRDPGRFIYRVSRKVPVMRQFVNSFAPAPDKAKS
jgi:predicted glycosyltransferase involved in capsule biosynthesis